MPMPPSSSPPRFVILWRMLLAGVLCGGVWWLWPADQALWRKVVTAVLAVGLAFQITASLQASSQGRVAAIKAWLECGAFLIVMAAVFYLPSAFGWLLLALGWGWRLLVRNLWK